MLPTKNFSDAGLDWGFMVSEPNNNRIAREQGILGPSNDRVLPGTVCGVAVLGAASVAAGKPGGGANTGNGVLTMDNANPVLGDAEPGAYVVTFESDTHYIVERPNGDQIGEGNIGAPFADDVKFNVAAGATPFVAGDGFTITVAQGTGVAVPLSLAAMNGGQTATKILGRGVPAAAANRRVAFATGPGLEVNGNLLTWPVGITPKQKAEAESQLAARGIKVRY